MIDLQDGVYTTHPKGAFRVQVKNDVALVCLIRTDAEKRFTLSEILALKNLSRDGKFEVQKQYWVYSTESSEEVVMHKNWLHKAWLQLAGSPLTVSVPKVLMHTVPGEQTPLPSDAMYPNNAKFEYAYTELMVPVL